MARVFFGSTFACPSLGMLLSLHTIGLELEIQRLKVLDVKGFPIMRHWYVVHRKDKRLSTVAQAFKAFLLKEAKRILG